MIFVLLIVGFELMFWDFKFIGEVKGFFIGVRRIMYLLKWWLVSGILGFIEVFWGGFEEIWFKDFVIFVFLDLCVYGLVLFEIVFKFLLVV